MPDNNLQSLVDELADDLSRAVVVDDPEVRLLCASRHYGDEDEQRIRAVLQREVGLQATQHILAQGISRWTAPGEIPANPELGMEARWCVPIRHRARLLGLLLVIDAHRTLTRADKDRIAQAASEIGANLYASHLEASDLRLRRERAVEDLLSGDEVVRHTGLQNLRAASWLIPDVPVFVTVVQVLDVSAKAPISARESLRTVLSDLQGTGAERWGMTIDRTRACLVESSNRTNAAELARDRAEQITKYVEQLLGTHSRCVAGLAAAAGGPNEAWCARMRASIAADAAAAPQFGPVALWENLGASAFLSQIPTPSLTPALLPAPVLRLAAADQPTWMIETLACFLDNAGSTSRTAAALHLHRTSLYYRLEKISEVTGCDLDDGEHRLLLHIGVRLLQRTSQMPEQST